MQRWEYTKVVETHSSETGQPEHPADLNQLGEQGWELVAVVPISLYQQMLVPRTAPMKHFLIEYHFKRPKGA